MDINEEEGVVEIHMSPTEAAYMLEALQQSLLTYCQLLHNLGDVEMFGTRIEDVKYYGNSVSQLADMLDSMEGIV